MRNKSRPGTNPSVLAFKAPSVFCRVDFCFVRFVDKAANRTLELNIVDVNGWSAAIFNGGNIHCEAVRALFRSPVCLRIIMNSIEFISKFIRLNYLVVIDFSGLPSWVE